MHLASVDIVHAPVEIERQRIPFHAGDWAAGIGVGLAFLAEWATDGVAGAAMSRALDQIASSVPIVRLGWVGRQFGGAMEQRVPDRVRGAQVAVVAELTVLYRMLVRA